MNAKPWSPDAVDVALDVLQRLPVEAVCSALGRCALEIGGGGYQPTLSLGDITKRTGIPSQAEVDEAECRAAWDVLLSVSRYVESDANGNYFLPKSRVVRTGEVRQEAGMPVHVAKGVLVPQLDQRSADALRRINGWIAIKTMTEDDFPFVQKRFYEEYRAWSATDAALSRGALLGNQGFQSLLDSRAMPEPKSLATVRAEVKQLKGNA